jgi:mRNA-degrading endonuclease toxin of MazEF toxin-antitoxin module
MGIEQGDIYWVTLRGEGAIIKGRRPCIIMSRLAVNNAGNTVVVVPMTTQGTPNPYYRISLPSAEILRDVASSSKVETSIAKCDHARVIDKSLLEGKIGKLTQTATIAVGLGLAYIFDLR